MNEYDSEKLLLDLEKNHYQQTGDIQEADMVLLNTCNIREKAAEKVYSELGRVKKIKDHKTDLKIGVTGCVAQAESLEIFDRQPAVDFIVGPQSYHKFPEIISKIDDGERNIIATNFEALDKFQSIASLAAKPKPSAFITIQEGCDKFCTFCIVPFTRGRERSRSVDGIVREVKKAINNGFSEITLLGQNVNSYNYSDKKFPELLDAVARVDGVKRIRYTSPHPQDVNEELLEIMAKHDNICNYIHLPLQAGSNRILKRMNRTYTKEHFVELALKIRDYLPGAGISTDIIVGFPGETDDDEDEDEYA